MARAAALKAARHLQHGVGVGTSSLRSFFLTKTLFAMPKQMPGGERAAVRQSNSCEDVAGVIEYLNWRKQYEQSDRDRQLGFLFCMAFDVDDDEIRDLDNDLLADSLIRSTYCYDDFVAE